MNLDQSPKVVPIISKFLPCLLRGGSLWLDHAPGTTAQDQGRLLTPTEKMTSLGVPLSQDHCQACGLDFPIFQDYTFKDSVLASEAGNGMNVFSIGNCASPNF